MMGAAAVGISSRRSVMRVTQPDLTLVLRGGRCLRDGRWDICDLGIDAAGKLRFGAGLRGPESFDATGKVVSPGFIDILADNASNPAVTFPIFEKYKVSDGVCTALQMHGGTANCAAYYQRLGAAPHAIIYGVSTFVMAIRNRAGSLAERRRQVERNLDGGALGVDLRECSHGTFYYPFDPDLPALNVKALPVVGLSAGTLRGGPGVRRTVRRRHSGW